MSQFDTGQSLQRSGFITVVGDVGDVGDVVVGAVGEDPLEH
jgi:hypothetical protein